MYMKIITNIFDFFYSTNNNIKNYNAPSFKCSLFGFSVHIIKENTLCISVTLSPGLLIKKIKYKNRKLTRAWWFLLFFLLLGLMFIIWRESSFSYHHHCLAFCNYYLLLTISFYISSQ